MPNRSRWRSTPHTNDITAEFTNARNADDGTHLGRAHTRFHVVIALDGAAENGVVSGTRLS